METPPTPQRRFLRNRLPAPRDSSATMNTLTINSRPISPTSPVLVIAEIGVNHDGRLDRALDLVQAAKSAGADAVKLQLFTADALMSPSCAFAQYQSDRCTEASPQEMLRRYELPPDDITRLVQAIRDANLLPLATPFSLPDLTAIQSLNLPAIKIASPDLVNRPLLHHASQLRKPLLLSTGASTLEEIQTTATWLSEWHAPFTLLHCISAYPTAPQDANLSWITELAHRFHVPVGYSDHTTDPLAGALAVAAGACIIEKHLTYDRKAQGPDHAASADPDQFRDYIGLIRQAQTLRGRPGRHVLPCEQDVRHVSRQSLVLRTPRLPGDTLREQDVLIQRPGTGIHAAQLQNVIGKKLLTPASPGQLLQWHMLAA